MPASRVESESKPEPKRWESDDYNEGKLIDKLAKDENGTLWNETVTGLAGLIKASGHNYQKEDKALEYYLEQMKEHCDPDSDKC